MPRELGRVLQVRAPDASGGADSFGSGYLIRPDLVLTAAHVVFSGSDLPPDFVAVRFSRARQWLEGQVIWPTRRGSVDAALIRITHAAWQPPAMAPARIGMLTGRTREVDCLSVGFPRSMAINRLRDTGQLHGTILPWNGLESGSYVIQLAQSPAATGSLQPEPWKGASGAAVLADDILIGVLSNVQPLQTSLTAVRMAEAFADTEFVEALAGPRSRVDIESVELARLFSSPLPRRTGRSVAGLLTADAEIVPFRGRSDLLDDYQTWCAEAEPGMHARLLTGPGGQGKTRFARQLCGRMRQLGWTAGSVSERANSDQIDRLKDSAYDALLVVDYAETRPDQVRKLMLAALLARDVRIMFLFLARSPGEWWEELRRSHDRLLDDAEAHELLGLEQDQHGRTEAYKDAQQAFLWALEGTEMARPSDTDPLTVELPDLQDAKYDSILTLHMTALMDLLQTGAARMPVRREDRIERRLLEHEQSYWEESAPARISRRPKLLRRIVAAAVLCGATDPVEARMTLRRIEGLNSSSYDKLGSIAQWLHELFPADDGRYWGPLQPDRIGEHLIEVVVGDEPSFVDQVLDLQDGRNEASEGQLAQATAVLARLGERFRQEGQLGSAISWYTLAATRDHHDSAFRLGELFKEKHQLDNAAYWYEQAAEDGHIDAAFNLGEMLRAGEAPELSDRWYQLAANGGHNDAAVRLGEMLAFERNRPDDAKTWFLAAARRGHTHAYHQLAWISFSIDDDLAKAEKYWRKAIAKDMTNQQYNGHLSEVLLKETAAKIADLGNKGSKLPTPKREKLLAEARGLARQAAEYCQTATQHGDWRTSELGNRIVAVTDEIRTLSQ
jgi:TPR repeat protein